MSCQIWPGGPAKNFGPHLCQSKSVFSHFGWMGGPKKNFSPNLCQPSWRVVGIKGPKMATSKQLSQQSDTIVTK